MPSSSSSVSRDEIGIGALGCGSRARVVLARLLAQSPRLRLRALRDPEADSIRATREALAPAARICGDDDELLSAPGIDWVFISSWNCAHAKQAIAALRAGKHVFCEKPLATSPEDCLAVREAVRETGRTFAFGLVLRCSPFYRKAHEIVRSGALGGIVSFEFNETLDFNHGGYVFGNWRRRRAQAGTHLLEKCCHDLDIANWLTGSLPARVASFGGRRIFVPENRARVEEIGPDAAGRAPFGWPAEIGARGDPFDGGADIVDHQVAILEYASGVRATFHTNCQAGARERRFYICGVRGSLRMDYITGEIRLTRVGWNAEEEVHDIADLGAHGGGDEGMARDLAATLLEGRPPAAGVEEGIRSAFTAFGIDQALDEGRVVDLRPLWACAGIDGESRA